VLVTTTFFNLPEDEQIEGIEAFSSEILSRYAIDVQSVASINFEYNATLKVQTTDGQLFALRVNINSPRTPDNLAAEIAWVNFLARDGRVNVPHPIANKQGDFHTSIFHEPSQRTLHCVLYSWLDGEEVGDEPSTEQLRALGAAMATLHKSSENFELPAGAKLPLLSDPMWETEDYLLGEKSVLDPQAKVLVARGLDAIASETKRLFASQKPQIIHADLHGWNVMWSDGKLSVLDFDDCGIGLPLQDLATAIYYLDTPEQEAALREGYESVAPLPELSQSDLDMLLLQRRIILLNYLYETSNAEHRAMIPEYLVESIRRIEKYLADNSR
jgi:Ser/Thr protein kinase RdoA (MazF antagonist)